MLTCNAAKKADRRADARTQHQADTEDLVRELFANYEDAMGTKNNDISQIFVAVVDVCVLVAMHMLYTCQLYIFYFLVLD